VVQLLAPDITGTYGVTISNDGNFKIAHDSPWRDDCSSLAKPSNRVEPNMPFYRW
jgi:hypothetical protein